MRVALLADIHGNAAALQAVLEDARTQGVEGYWFLGDILGYGPLPVTCINLLDHKEPTVWLMGNHDLAGLSFWNGADSSDAQVRRMTPGLDEQRVAAWHAEQLREGMLDERVQQLQDAPTWTIAYKGVYAAHGAILSMNPKDPKNISGRGSYMHFDSPGRNLTLDTILDLCGSEGSLPWLVVVGHTHVPTLADAGWKKPRRWTWREIIELPFNEPEPVSLADLDGEVVILCPGSVGQPRRSPGDPRAAYAILDLKRRTVWFRRVAYNVGETLAAMVPPPREILGLRELRNQLSRAR